MFQMYTADIEGMNTGVNKYYICLQKYMQGLLATYYHGIFIGDIASACVGCSVFMSADLLNNIRKRKCTLSSDYHVLFMEN